jgi:hypothetical protein
MFTKIKTFMILFMGFLGISGSAFAEDCIALYKELKSPEGEIGQIEFIKEYCSATKEENQSACDAERKARQKDAPLGSGTFSVTYRCMTSTHSDDDEA